jgi:hypothetical protein
MRTIFFAAIVLLLSCRIAFSQPNVVAQTINGTPQADQFTGSDMCDKLRAANLYAIAHQLNLVDATHFTGVQTCAVDPFKNLSGSTNASLNLTDRLGAVVVNASIPVVITTNGFHLEGMGYAVTWWRYTGVASTAAVITTQSPNYVSGTDSPGSDLDDISIKNISVLGGGGGITDGLLLNATHHSEIANVSTWGMTGCGIHTYFAVTDTFYRPRTSYVENSQLNYGGTAPNHGLCFDGPAGLQTTDGTVTDAAAEGGKRLRMDAAQRQLHDIYIRNV